MHYRNYLPMSFATFRAHFALNLSEQKKYDIEIAAFRMIDDFLR